MDEPAEDRVLSCVSFHMRHARDYTFKVGISLCADLVQHVADHAQECDGTGQSMR